MAKGKKKTGEQLDLIDVQPKNAKEIMAATKMYKKHQADRLAAGKKEVKQKAVVLELVKNANLQPLADGVIRFELDGTLFSVTPRDELIQITVATQVSEVVE